MPLQTRENPESGRLEVFAEGEWIEFDEYRERQITEAYDKSVKFLRERLGEDDAARQESRKPSEKPQ
jgi:hypothetical protein